MLNRIARRLVTGLGIATLTGAALAPQAAEARQAPALWSVSDADTTVYLFGTIHLLPEKYKWQTPALEEAVSGSQELVIETIIDEKNPQALLATLMKMAMAPGLPPIGDRVPPAKRAALQAAIAKSGLPAAAFDRMKTWAVAFMLIGTEFRNMGLQNGQGVEPVLKGEFTSEGKPIGELETNAEQLGFFDSLPEKAQLALLEGAIETPGNSKAEFQGMLSAWRRGDVNAIARTFNRGLSSSSDLRDALLRRRNANWSRWIETRMQKPGSLLIAVG
ncbi:TraB/GumN family protein, partial [Sphingomonas sp.]|uniref:TraB/GumN family protein n=1 Tax=Sphingomonas sp. TaxID=28214 RepID=UPI0025E735A8